MQSMRMQKKTMIYLFFFILIGCDPRSHNKNTHITELKIKSNSIALEELREKLTEIHKDHGVHALRLQ